MKKPELLAPAGNMQALKAAVWAGADAVYFGGKLFNARSYADNFGDDVYTEAVSFCRLYGVKVYLTLNTLLTDREISLALEYVAKLEAGLPPDAYIVQDVGLISTLKRRFPHIAVHASTQMQQHGRLCADFLKKLGVSRVVLARECSAKDISAVVETGIETEVFIHGAVCVCQSGGCLMSSVIGGRSGNRGECAQPCRQSYNGGYPLSLKDICLASHIQELMKLGVSCFKIEGRMKSAEYVYQTVKVYRAAIDGFRSADLRELQLLEHSFSRSGFSDGYFVNKLGRQMFGIRTQEDKNKTKALNTVIEERKINVEITCRIGVGKAAYIKASACGAEAEFFGAVPQKAIKCPITETELVHRLSKTGNTPFSVTVRAMLDEGLMLPVSSINELRRKVLASLRDAIIKKNIPSCDNTLPSVYCESDRQKRPMTKENYLVVRFDGQTPSVDLLQALSDSSERVELPLWQPLPQLQNYSKISLVLPRVILENDLDAVRNMIRSASKKGVSQLTVSNFSHIALCKGFTVHGDYALNVVNSQTITALKEFGFSTLTVSPELNPSIISSSDLPLEFLVYGRTPVMHTANCIISNVRECTDDGQCTAFLTDKTGASFPAFREFRHRNTIYNSVPTYILDKTAELARISGHIMLFTDENEEKIYETIKFYKHSEAPQGKFTRGALKKGGGAFGK